MENKNYEIEELVQEYNNSNEELEKIKKEYDVQQKARENGQTKSTEINNDEEIEKY